MDFLESWSLLDALFTQNNFLFQPCSGSDFTAPHCPTSPLLPHLSLAFGVALDLLREEKNRGA